MKICQLSIIVLFLLSMNVSAQRKVEQIDPEKEAEKAAEKKQEERAKAAAPKWHENVSFGGNIGGGFSNYGSFFMVQPMAFYRFTETTMGGLGVSYFYWSQNFQSYSGAVTKVSDHAYGFNIFARQMLFEPVFVHAELMPLNFTTFNYANADLRREWVSSLYLGGGINQQISDRAGFYIMMLYDVLYDDMRSFRPSPIDIRTGFYF